MVSTRKRKYTPRVPREGGDANIAKANEPNLALNGKWTLATGKVLNTNKKNLMLCQGKVNLNLRSFVLVVFGILMGLRD